MSDRIELISPHLVTKVPKTYDGEKIAISANISGKIGYLPAEN
jgi:hypothetical protein